MCVTASALYRLLGDEARLRLLRVLDRERLNVTELTSIIGLAQSGVSRHLGMLKDAGLVSEHKDAGYTYFRLAPALSEDGQRALWEALQEQFAAAAGDPAVQADEARLQEVLRLRKENFEATSPTPATRGSSSPAGAGPRGRARSGSCSRRSKVADLGCGDGYLAIEASRWASRVIAVDRSKLVLERARALGARRRVTNVVWKRGELEKLPIKDATVDVALLSQALHHAANPAHAVAEAARITVPGGRVIVLDLRQHQEAWVRAKLGDRRLGFRDEELKAMLTDAGLARCPRRRRGAEGRRPVHGADCLGTEAGSRFQDDETPLGLMTTTMPSTDTRTPHPIEKLLEDRIAIIDGAMGTTIRTYGMTEADIRGERFKDSKKDLLNNGDIFSLTQPAMICDIHRRFLEAGADIIETNTFGATSITQSEFFVDDPREHGGRKDPEFYQKIIEDPFLNDLAWEINEQSARQCREWADRVANADGRPRFVAGAIGPLTVSLSNSPDADDAGFRVVTFDQVKAAYIQQVRALIAGGSDLLLVETIFDSLNAKAALVAIQEVFDGTAASCRS